MVYQTKFSKDEIKSIGIRMHAARILTGMSREEFAERQNVPVMSIKNWELGRAMPRNEGIMSIVAAFKNLGVFVSHEWVLFGSGVGPNYIETSTHERESDQGILEQIDLFKKSQRAQGHNPVVITVNDDQMSPLFQKGDIIGGIILSHESVRKDVSVPNLGRPWILSDKDGSFGPCFLYYMADQWFTNTASKPELKECGMPSIAKIKWHFQP